MKIQIPIDPIESGEGFVKFHDGTLICYGQVTALANEQSCTWIFPVPFVKEPVICATHQWSYHNNGNVTIGKVTKENSEIFIWDKSEETNFNRHAFVSAYGRWK